MNVVNSMPKRVVLVNVKVNVTVNVRRWKGAGGRCLKKIGVSR